MKKYLVEYSSNNSGGNWWLKDKDWKNLEKAGWLIDWNREADYKNGNHQYDKNGLPIYKDSKRCKEERWLGALATHAYKRFDSIEEALKEFESITGADITDEGCNCCGAPHSFSWEDKKGNRGYCSGESCGEYLLGIDLSSFSKRDLLNKN